MAMKRRSSFADPTAEQAMNRVMRRLVRKAQRRGLPVIGYEVWECDDPRCLIEDLG